MAVEIDIKVGKEVWRIRGELRQWACGKVRKNKKSGKLEHHPEFFYASLEGMLKGVAERKLRLSDATSFEELRQEHRRINDEIKGLYAFDPAGDGDGV